MKVLLVDDDPGLREVLSNILKIKGFETASAETGAEALAGIEQQDIDVALVDLKLEDASGLEVLRGIKERSPHTECILLTGYASPETAIQAVNLGVYSYFQEPYDKEQLLISVQRAGEKRVAKQALAASEARLSSIVRAAPIGIGVVSERIFQQVNDRLCEMSGYTTQELIGQSARIVYPNDAEFERVGREKYEQIRREGHGEIETRWKRKDGRIIDILLASTPLVTGDLSKGVMFTALDITERKLHERELEAEAMVSQALRETVDLPTLLERVLEAARHAIPAAEKGTLALLVGSDHLQVRAIHGYRDSSVQGFTFPLTWGYAGRAARLRQPLLIADVQADAELQKAAGQASIGEVRNLQSAVAVPLLAQETLVGVLSLESAQVNTFNEADLGLLANFATSAALILERARLFDETRQRVAALEMLYESGLALNRLTSPKEIGQKIIELLEQKLEWHHTTIRLFHPETDSLELLAFQQPGLDSEAERRATEERFQTLVARPGQGLSGWAVQHGQSVRSGDLPHEPRYTETFPGLHSGLYAPMKLGGRVVGVISVESEKPDAFDEADEQLTNTLAAQAAIAFENARLFEETRQRAMELETINRISITLRAIADRDTMLAVVLEETLRALNISDGSINLWERATNKIRQTTARGWLVDFSDAPVQPGEGVFGWVFANNKPYVSKDFSQDPVTLSEIRPHLPPGWGGACIPIRSTEAVLGVLLVSAPEPREFNHDDLRLLNTLAEMTGTALHRMSLNEETARRAREFASLYETSTALAAETELDKLLQVIAEHARDLIHAESSGLYLFDAQRGDLEVALDTAHHMTIGTRARFGEGMAGRVAQTRQPMRMDDYSTWEGRNPAYEGLPFRAIVEVPMLYHGELIGVLVASEFGDSRRKFSEADERLLALFASQAAGAIHSARLHQEMTRNLNRLQSLRVMDHAIAGSLDRRVTLNILLDQVLSQLRVDAADVLLLNPLNQTLQFAAGQGFRTPLNESASVRVGESFAGRAALERRLLRVEDAQTAAENPQFYNFWLYENFSCYYAAPLVAKGQVKGVIEVFTRSPSAPDAEWLNFFETLADQTAIAIDNAQLFDHLQGANVELLLAYDATIEGWSRAMELRDEETEGHTQRVTDQAMALARAAGMGEEEIIHLRRGALLHDIGKIGVPDRILLKPGPLTEKEWEIMRRHPQYAYEMLRPISHLRRSLDIPYMHHEKWDGTGYPQGLKGEQIPLAARIFALVDVYDALISDRPYRKAWSAKKTIAHIRKQRGKHFDPKLVELFLKLTADKKD